MEPNAPTTMRAAQNSAKASPSAVSPVSADSWAGPGASALAWSKTSSADDSDGVREADDAASLAPCVRSTMLGPLGEVDVVEGDGEGVGVSPLA
jgi:hypothetical protein